MRKTLLLTFMLFSFVIGRAQTGKELKSEIKGIGVFKIGETTISIIPEIEELLKIKLRTVNNKNEELSSIDQPGAFLKIEPNENLNENPVNADLCPKSKVYFIKLYEVSGLKIENIFLTFYEDKLVSLRSDGSFELQEALFAKYGKPAAETSLQNSLCKERLTDPSKNNSTKEFKWANGNIRAMDFRTITYDSNCKGKIFWVFAINDKVKTQISSECALKWYSETKKKNAEKLKSTLSDF